MKISIVTINLNKRAGLARTLASLARQSNRDFELIVVDGGSNDGSLEECARHGDLITRLIAESDRGIFDAWNKGIRAASGDLISLLNSGDEYHPEVIATVAACERARTSAEQGAIFCGTTVIVEKGQVRKSIGNVVRRRPMLGLGISHPATFVQKRVYERIGPYENISIAADAKFLLRCLRAGVEFVPCGYTVYMEAGGISDKAATRGFAQYVDALRALEFCGGFSAALLKASYTSFRRVTRTPLGKFARDLLANTRHFTILLMNLLQRLIFGGPPRRWLLAALGFSVHRSAFVSPGVQFYRTGNVSVGAGSVLNRGVTIDNRDTITIGVGCSISHSVHLMTGGHDIDSPYFEYEHRPLVIRDHVVVFAGAYVLPGTTLEDGVVVLPGSVISGVTVANGVYGGVPARFIRPRKSEPLHEFDYQRPFAL
jgi:acetyltransferase-like isoleucine patch superfamily enzyme